MTIIAQNIDLAADGKRHLRTPACRRSKCGCPSAPIRSGCVSRSRSRLETCGAELRQTLLIRSRAKLRRQPGPGAPVIHFDQWDKDQIGIKLILKGGCENTNAQYSVPVELRIGRADRNLDSVRKCILHAV